MSEITEAWNSFALASAVETPISNVIAINSNTELAQKPPEDDINYLDSKNKVVALPLELQLPSLCFPRQMQLKIVMRKLLEIWKNQVNLL